MVEKAPKKSKVGAVYDLAEQAGIRDNIFYGGGREDNKEVSSHVKGLGLV